MSAASLRRAMMALPDSSTGTPSTRTLPFEPGANGITVFSLRSIITQLLFHYTRVDERQSIQLYKSPTAQMHDAQRVVHKRQYRGQSNLCCALQECHSALTRFAIMPPVRQPAVSAYRGLG